MSIGFRDVGRLFDSQRRLYFVVRLFRESLSSKGSRNESRRRVRQKCSVLNGLATVSLPLWARRYWVLEKLP